MYRHQRGGREKNFDAGNYSFRHVSFKNDQNNGYSKNRFRNSGSNNLKRFIDQDVPMNNIQVTRPSRFVPYGLNDKKNNNFHNDNAMWYKITLENGTKYNRHDLFRKLHDYLDPTPLIPLCVKVEDRDLSFFVDSSKTALDLRNANLKIELSDGWKLQIKTCAYKTPDVEIDSNLKQKLKLVMGKRYHSDQNSLDLSNFHADEDFIKDDLFVSLNRNSVFLIVLQIIASEIPHLRKLILSNNKLFLTDALLVLKRFAKQLKILDLSYNRIRNISDIAKLEGLHLEEILLDNNPLCKRFRNKDNYIREIRKIFPDILRLDGVPVSSVVGFGSQRNNDAASSLSSFLETRQHFIIPEANETVSQIIQQFYLLYDNENSRKDLMNAYHEQAQFSMSSYGTRPGQGLYRYIKESRNLLKVDIPARRSQVLHKGLEQIFNTVERFPKTQTYVNLLTVDLSSYSPERFVITLTGLFREIEVTNPSIESGSSGDSTAKDSQRRSDIIRAFARTFVFVPINDGYKIINDMLLIFVPSNEEMQNYQWNKLLDNEGQSSSTVSPSAAIVPPVMPPAATNSAEELTRKQEMVRALSSQTRMNLQWAEKCLSDTNWDFNLAVQAFTNFNSMGVIPAEAFIGV